MRLSYGASESCYALRSALRRNKGQEDDQQAVVIADMKRRSPTAAELPPDVNAFNDPAAWASQVGNFNASRGTDRRVQYFCITSRNSVGWCTSGVRPPETFLISLKTTVRGNG